MKKLTYGLSLSLLFFIISCSPAKDTASENKPDKTPKITESIDDEFEEVSKPSNKKEKEESKEVEKVDDLEFENLPSSGSYTLKELQKALKKVDTNNTADIIIYDDVGKIKDFDTYKHQPGKSIEFTFVANSDDNETIQETVDITIEGEETTEDDKKDDKETEGDKETEDDKKTEEESTATGNATIYGLFASGSYPKETLKDMLTKLTVDAGNVINIHHNDVHITDIKKWSPEIGTTTIKLTVIESSGSKTEKTINVTVELDKLKLKRLPSNEYSQIWTTEGCGGLSEDFGVHKPNAPTGFKPLGHVLSDDNYWLGGNDFFVVKEDQPGLVAKPTKFVQTYYTYGGGCDDANVRFWRPYPPAGYICLGDFAVPSDNTPTEDNSPILCINEQFIKDGDVGSYEVADDYGTGIDHADSAFHQCGGSTNFHPKTLRVTGEDYKPEPGLCRAIKDESVEWVD